MTDDERMDQLLHQTMAARAPGPSSDFDARLGRRLRATGPSRAGRLLLAAYAIVALGATVWVMRSASLDWMFVASAVVPVAIVVAVYRRRLGTHAQ